MALRVTQKAMHLAVTANLQSNLTRLQRLQEQLSSGRQIARPSDSPTGTVSALRLRADLRRSEQLVRNADDGIGWLSTADNALTGALDVVGRVRGLLLTGINGSMGPEARDAIATEIEGLRAHLVGVANTRYLDRPVFAGASSAASDAFAPDGTYQGDDTTVRRTVLDGLAVEVNVPGREVFGPDGANVFDVLGDIAAHLRGAPEQLDADLARLDEHRVSITTALARVGARYHQVETMRDRTEAAMIDAESALAEVESIDLPRTVLELELQEVAYQAALAATARVVQPSLVDFLR